MADIRECFSTIQDATTGGGECLISRVEGEAAAAQEGSIGFSFKDSSGNVILPQLTSDGKIPVDTEANAGVCITAHGELAAGSATLADVTGATTALTVAKTYTKIGVNVCCLRASLFQLQYVDDDGGGGETTTVLDEWIVGPGHYTVVAELNCLELDTTGGTGTQTLKLQAKNFTNVPAALSSLRGTISAFEVA